MSLIVYQQCDCPKVRVLFYPKPKEMTRIFFLYINRSGVPVRKCAVVLLLLKLLLDPVFLFLLSFLLLLSPSPPPPSHPSLLPVAVILLFFFAIVASSSSFFCWHGSPSEGGKAIFRRDNAGLFRVRGKKTKCFNEDYNAT